MLSARAEPPDGRIPSESRNNSDSSCPGLAACVTIAREAWYAADMMIPKIRTLLAFGVAALAMACSSDSDDGGSGGRAGSGGGATGGAGGAATGGAGGASGGAGGAATGGAGGAATGGAGGSGGATPCTALCANPDIGKCPNDPAAAECMADCEKGRDGITKCKAEYDAFLACAASQSAANLECDSNGTTFVKSGVCASEISAFQACAS